jgi:hypothetical protein
MGNQAVGFFIARMLIKTSVVDTIANYFVS